MASKMDVAKMIPAGGKKKGSAKAVVAGKQLAETSGGTIIRMSEAMEGIRVELAFTVKDGSGRKWTAGLSGVGKTKEAAIQDLQAEFARRPIRIQSIVEKALEGIQKEGAKMSTPIAPLNLEALPEGKLREMATKMDLKVEGGKTELIAALTKARNAILSTNARPAAEGSAPETF